MIKMCVMPADSMRAATAKGDFGMSVGQLYHQVTSISANADGGANGRCCAQATEKDVRSNVGYGGAKRTRFAHHEFCRSRPKAHLEAWRTVRRRVSLDRQVF